jgi:hypothetical protein
MGRIFAAIKPKVRALIRRTLAELVQFLVTHPWLYKRPYNALRKYYPSLHRWLIHLLRRFQIIGAGAKLIRVRGDQGHNLSPLGEHILLDLEAIVITQKESK